MGVQGVPGVPVGCSDEVVLAVGLGRRRPGWGRAVSAPTLPADAREHLVRSWRAEAAFLRFHGWFPWLAFGFLKGSVFHFKRSSSIGYYEDLRINHLMRSLMLLCASGGPFADDHV